MVKWPRGRELRVLAGWVVHSTDVGWVPPVCHALLKRMNEVIDLDVTVDLKKKNKTQEGVRLKHIKKRSVWSMCNVLFLWDTIGLTQKFLWVFPQHHRKKPWWTFWPMAIYWALCYKLLPLRATALLLFLTSLEVEIHKSEAGTSCRSD